MKQTLTKIAAVGLVALPFIANAQMELNATTTTTSDRTSTSTSTGTQVTTPVMQTMEPAAAQKTTPTTTATFTKLSTTDSMIMWKATKTGGAHNGTVMIKDGVFAPDKVKGIRSGTFTIDMSTIVSLDLKDNLESKAKLENHLKSADFFDIEKYPTAKFRVLKTVLLNKKAGTIQVIGELNIKGIKKAVTFKATQKIEDGKLVITSNDFKINRTKFNVKFGSSLMEQLKDRFINDNFTTSVKLVLTK